MYTRIIKGMIHTNGVFQFSVLCALEREVVIKNRAYSKK